MSEEKKQYDNRNRWAVWKNATPKKDDRDADYSGTLNVDGEEFFIDGWLGETRDGKKMMSGRIKPKQQRQQERPSQRQRPDPDDDF